MCKFRCRLVFCSDSLAPFNIKNSCKGRPEHDVPVLNHAERHWYEFADLLRFFCSGL